MALFLHVVGWALTIYMVTLVTRMILEWVRVFSPNWRPRGAMLVVAEVVYTITDPPIRLARRLIPPLRLGRVSLDLGFMVVFLLVAVLAQVLVRW